MKEKIVLFVIGVLVGAIISTGAFYIYTTTNSCNNSNQSIPMNEPPQMPNNENGQRPQMPNENNNNQENN